MSSAAAAARRRQQGQAPDDAFGQPGVEGDPDRVSLGSEGDEDDDEDDVFGTEQTFASAGPRPDDAVLETLLSATAGRRWEALLLPLESCAAVIFQVSTP
jgi:hypothetical protein